jgi:2-dehydro-3-deoxy-D-arabinonate dehydratase
METCMSQMFLVRFYLPGYGARVGVMQEGVLSDVTAAIGSVGDWLRASAGRVADAIAQLEQTATTAPLIDAAQLEQSPAPDRPHWLPPVDVQDVWAAGVTYERSRAARQEEAIDGGDVYARVYIAARPELFFKARGPWVMGPNDPVGIRRDARWNVPEPELALVINPALEIVGVTIGNDMSSRDIEGENPLYLPQAKMYSRSCALGPAIALGAVHAEWPAMRIALEIRRDGALAFQGDTHTSQIRRRPAELVAFLGRCLDFPDGVVLLTGAGVVPPDTFTLAAGDSVQITIDGIGVLTNSVIVV